MSGRRPATGRQDQVVIVGDSSAAEFVDVVSVPKEAPEWDVATYGTLTEWFGSEDTADLLVILQRWPEEYSPQQVDDVLDRYPLTRLIVCCGPWCDSDGRTRSLWPVGSRVRAESAVARLRYELRVIRGESHPLPMTANRDEAYVYDYTSLDRPDDGAREGPLRIAIDSADPAIFDWLHAAIESAGHRIVPAAEQSADVCLCDVDPWTPTTAASFVAMQRAEPATLIIALAGYLRRHEAAAMQQAGAKSVVAKLTPLGDLLKTIHDTVAEERKTRASASRTSNVDVGELRVVRCDL